MVRKATLVPLTLAGVVILRAMVACVGSDPDVNPQQDASTSSDAGIDSVADSAGGNDASDALADAGPACIVDGEAFDLCDSFDDRGTTDPFVPPWSTITITTGTSLVRSTEEKVSSPQGLRAELPAVVNAASDRQDIAEVVKSFGGSVQALVADFALRIEPVELGDSGVPAYPMFFVRTVFSAPGDLVGITQQLKLVSVDGGIAPEMRAQGFLTGGPLSPAWTVSPTLGTWHHVRQTLTLSAGAIGVTVVLDGETVLAWSIQTAIVPTKIDLSLGAFAGAFAGGGHPAYTVRFDDVRLAAR